MKILFVSSLYSTPSMPARSPGNARIVRAMRRYADCRVISPVPWYPRLMSEPMDALRPLLSAPASEPDGDGSMTLHPRTYHIPGVARRLNATLYAASIFKSVRDEVRRWRPDVVLAAFAYPDGTAMVALGAILGVQVVVRAMGNDINEAARHRGRRWQIAWALRRASAVIAVSSHLARRIRRLGVPRRNITIIPTGVDTGRFFPRDRAEARRQLRLPNRPVLLVPTAHLSAEKGIELILHALRAIKERVPIHAVLLGDGDRRQALVAHVRRLGLRERVRFDGFQPEARMPLYYSAVDLVCLASSREGWPDVLMESFACGCPVVVSGVGGMPEIVDLTGGGLVVPPGEVAPLADAIAQAFHRTWDRPAIARAMDAYPLENTARRYVALCAAAARRPRVFRHERNGLSALT